MPVGDDFRFGRVLECGGTPDYLESSGLWWLRLGNWLGNHPKNWLAYT
jgi:hypothetical protein